MENKTVDAILEKLKKGLLSSDEAFTHIKKLQEFGTDLITNEAKTNLSGSMDIKAQVAENLRALLSSMLKIDLEEIDISEDISEFGLDSVLQIGYINAINNQYDIVSTPTIFYELDEKTLYGLASKLIEKFNLKLDNNEIEESHILKPIELGGVKSKHSVLECNEEGSDIASQCNYNDTDGKEVYESDDLDEKYAVIGLSLRTSGCGSVEEYWERILQKEDCLSETNGSQKEYVKFCGMIPEVDLFAAELFNISRREAIVMDPQQRKMLEAVWETFEDSGYRITDFAGRKVGVFVGASSHDYADLLIQNGQMDDSHGVSGNSNAIISNRISYIYDFCGPCETLETACSSSLVALNRAILSLKNKECEIALVGGAQINLDVWPFRLLRKAGMLSEDTCNTLDDSAKGYTRGEGVGAVLIKPAKKAVEDGDNIYGIIAGVAENHGGRANSLTAPNVNAQAGVIYDAVIKSGVKVTDIGFVELHGTGTKLGDPVEIDGLKKAYKKIYSEQGCTINENTCGLGAVKTNVGHAEAASGLIGLIKVLLCLKNRKLPGIVHFIKGNKLIDYTGTPFYPIRDSIDWKAPIRENGTAGKRCAGLSSFGFGGTNVHVVLEEYISKPRVSEKMEEMPFFFAAQNTELLKEYVKRIVDFLCTNFDAHSSLSDVSFTLCNGRTVLRGARMATTAMGKDELIYKLNAYIAGGESGCNLSEKAKDKGIFESKGMNAEALSEGFCEGKNYDMTDWFVNRCNSVSLPHVPLKRDIYWNDKIPNREKYVIANTKIPIEVDYKVELVSEGEKEDMRDIEEIKKQIRTYLADVLFVDQKELENNLSFREQGMDSILGTEFVSILNERMEVSIKSGQIYDYSTVDDLSEFICRIFDEKKEEMPVESAAVQRQEGGIVLAPLRNCTLENEEKRGNATTQSFFSDESQKEIENVKVGSKIMDYSEILDTVKDILAKILFIESSEVSMDNSFREQGLDSILGVEFMNELNDIFGTDLKSSVIYDYPNAIDVTNYLMSIEMISPEGRAVNHSFNLDTVVELASTVSEEKEIKRQQKEKPDDEAKEVSKDIAIVGLSLRVPGAENKDEFWELLKEGRSAVTKVPDERWDISDTSNGAMYCKTGGFMKDADKFDPMFFNLSPAETKSLDPRQRIVMEEMWKTFEDAGYSMDDLDGKKCCIYLGLSTGEEYKSGALMNCSAVSAARLSYFLNLKGEALSVDTSCSSSMVCVNLACRALWEDDEMDMALASGVSLYIYPESYVKMCKGGMLSHKGMISAFDDSADGFVPGEAVAGIVLMRLDKALKKGCHVYGLIKGIGMNQDGRTNGITAPSGKAQASLEKEVYSKNNITPSSISYVECHGTGTKLGDPIEISGLEEAYATCTNKDARCPIGSVKSNIGHTSAASGLVSIIKVLLSMEHGQLPPSINYHTANKNIDFEKSHFYVNQSLCDWKVDGKKRAAVSSFGISGTNVHVVLEEYKKNETHNTDNMKKYIVPISAKSEESLNKIADRLCDWLQNHPEKCFEDIVYTLAIGRTHMSKRRCFVVSSREELIEQLKDDRGIGALEHSESFGNLKSFAALDSEQAEKIGKQIALEYLQGKSVKWKDLYGNHFHRRCDLPTYPFKRMVFPFVKQSTEYNQHKNKSVSFQIEGDEQYLKDYCIYGKKTVSTVAYAEYIRKAAKILYNRDVKSILNMDVKKILTVKTHITLLVEMKIEDEKIAFSVYSEADGSLILHATGYSDDIEHDENWTHVYTNKVIEGKSESVDEYYKSYDGISHVVGKTLQSMKEITYDSDRSNYVTKISVPDGAGYGNTFFNNAQLEGIVQSLCVASSDDVSARNDGDRFYSFGYEELVLKEQLPKEFFVQSSNRNKFTKEGFLELTGVLLDENKKVVGWLKNFRCRKLKRTEEKPITIQKNKAAKINYTLFENEIENLFKDILELNEIDKNESLSEYGFTSMSVIELLDEVKKKYGVDIDTDVIIDLEDYKVSLIAQALFERVESNLLQGDQDEGAIEAIDESEAKSEPETMNESIELGSKKEKSHTCIVGYFKRNKNSIIKQLDNLNSWDRKRAIEYDEVAAIIEDTFLETIYDAAFTKEYLLKKQIYVYIVLPAEKMVDHIEICKKKDIPYEGFAEGVLKEAGLSGYGFDNIGGCLSDSVAMGIRAIRNKECDYSICLDFYDGICSAMILGNEEIAVSNFENIYSTIDKFERIDEKEYGFSALNKMLDACGQNRCQVFGEIANNCHGNVILRGKKANYMLSIKRCTVSNEEKNNDTFIVPLSAHSKTELYNYCHTLSAYLKSKVVYSHSDIFEKFESKIFSDFSKRLVIENGSYTAKSISACMELLESQYGISSITVGLEAASSLRVFVKYLYREYKNKIIDIETCGMDLLQSKYHVRLCDISYTMQFGRAEDNVRVSFCISSVSELIQQLDEIEKLGFENERLNDIVASQLNMFTDTDIDEMIKGAIERESFKTILGFWNLGKTIDWNMFWKSAKGRRISLPVPVGDESNFECTALSVFNETTDLVVMEVDDTEKVTKGGGFWNFLMKHYTGNTNR